MTRRRLWLLGKHDLSQLFARLLWLSFHENVKFSREGRIQVFPRLLCPTIRETSVFKFLREHFNYSRLHENTVFKFSR